MFSLPRRGTLPHVAAWETSCPTSAWCTAACRWAAVTPMPVQMASCSSNVTLGSKCWSLGCIFLDLHTRVTDCLHLDWNSDPDPSQFPPFKAVACCMEVRDHPFWTSAHSVLDPCLQLLTNYFLSVAKAALKPTDEPDKVTCFLQIASSLLCASALSCMVTSPCLAARKLCCNLARCARKMLPVMLSLVIALLAGQKAQTNAGGLQQS